MRMKSKSSITTRASRRAQEPTPRVPPGWFLAELLEELQLSQSEFARAIGVSPMRISHIIKGTRPVTAELALLFGRVFGQSPEYWLNLQWQYDLHEAKAALKSRLEAVQPLVR
jgi:addiction module HigA family antidote